MYVHTSIHFEIPEEGITVKLLGGHEKCGHSFVVVRLADDTDLLIMKAEDAAELAKAIGSAQALLENEEQQPKEERP
jgi:hypothetical protein